MNPQLTLCSSDACDKAEHCLRHLTRTMWAVYHDFKPDSGRCEGYIKSEPKTKKDDK